MEPRYVLYNSQEVPHEVYSLSAFCREHGLDLEAMKNVTKGRTRQHQGWHLDEARTARLKKLATEIQGMFEESERKYGVAFRVK